MNLFIFPFLMVMLHASQSFRLFATGGQRVNPEKRMANSITMSQAEHEHKPTKVFLGNLPFTITEDQITAFVETTMKSQGVLDSIEIAKGKKSKAPRGFAFLKFRDAQTAEAAASILDGADFDGRIVNSNLKANDEPSVYAQRKRVVENTVYLSNLDYSLIEEEINNMCEDLLGPGLVKSIEMPVDKATGRLRGFCYVEFTNQDTVNKAIVQFNGLDVLGRLLQCDKMVMNKRETVKW